ncbi:sensor histidine kinase [Roseburia hominis]
MDTKLKNRRKLAIFLIICTILIPTFVVIYQYPYVYNDSREMSEQNQEGYLTSESFMGSFLRTACVMYQNEEGQEAGKRLLDGYPFYNRDYDCLSPYLEYQVQDQEENILDGNTSDMKKQKMTLDNLKTQAYFGVALEFDSEGKASMVEVVGERKEEQIFTLRELLNDPDYWITEDNEYYEDRTLEIDGTQVWASSILPPRDRTYYFVMTREGLERCLQNAYVGGIRSDELVYLVLALSACVGLVALLLPHFKSLGTGEEWIFHAPLELVVILGSTGLGAISGYCDELFMKTDSYTTAGDYLIWILYFGLMYWVFVCLRQIHALGFRRYCQERTWTWHAYKWLRGRWRSIWLWAKRQIDKVYHVVDTLDFTEKSNRTILKIVLINFVLLVSICMFWFYGIIGLVIYSVILFFILQRYYGELRDKYTLILNATGRIAEGHLDTEIGKDLGIFTSFGTELDKIQRGFKKAVDEEVKSQKMKTELITNVSHDLKTPLTAIITYVNLLKEEGDEEKRRAYVGVLEQKSLRLKALIEDLFEISKASSDNITLNLVNLDIVGLFKQVSFEMEDKLRENGLVMRFSHPEERIILHLDSQKTYRIFSNLIGNISKYALPNTRVYAEIKVAGGEVVITLKNVSATELNFDPEEITDRFVRGDLSRNTDGSGLGLAIVKSFVELQGGTFRIETEADLFKAQIRWPVRNAI